MAGLRRWAMVITVMALFGVSCSESSADLPERGDALERSNPCQDSTQTSADDATTTPTTAERSVARQWNEAALDAVRRDFPAPTVHARNLFHLSVAMWDTWAAWEPGATGHLVDTSTELPIADRELAIGAAAHRLLSDRYTRAVGATASLDQFDRLITQQCGDPGTPAPGTAAAFGVDVAEQILAAARTDGSNEVDAYVDPDGYEPVNPGLQVELAYTSMADPNRWQPLELERRITQNGQEESETLQSFIGPHWGSVTPFAMDPAAAPVPVDPGPPPYLTFGEDPEQDAVFIDAAMEVVAYSALLDPTDGEMIDLSPAVRGNSPLGSYESPGYGTNPVTGEAYDANVVRHADYGRVVAEFWADGPDSETPPGHWNTIANEVSDALAAQPDFDGFRVGGDGDAVDRLEWDLSLYLALNGATHDAAIAAWGAKGFYDYVRPISMIRYLAGLGQSTDPDLPSYHPQGLPLIDGISRLDADGEVELWAWNGAPPEDARETVTGGVGWIRAGEWVPYQLPTFVTPAFAGYVSGHSTFSRAAAEVLTGITGSEYFPGGLFEHTIEAGSLHFEAGPTTDVTLQWARYADAADEAGLSRLYGGIHVWADDLY
ncbi:MAG: vanadium-dependent haloperoxidase, partial [Actinomycetota bacterium]